MAEMRPLAIYPTDAVPVREMKSGDVLPVELLATALSLQLTGLNKTDPAVITAVDTILGALGKLQAQASNKVDKDGAKVLSDNNFTNAAMVKLANIAEQATKNAADDELRDRSTHTGTQGMETITGLSAALDTRVVKTSETGAAILPEGTDAERPAPGATGLYVRLSKTSGKPEWFNRTQAAWEPIGDTSQLATQLGAVDARVQSLEANIGFTIIYPNGGTEAAPANVSPNVIYTMANPFPGKSVLCVAEIFRGGRWGIAGFGSYYPSGVNASFGVEAFYSPATDSVKVKTGSTSLINTARLDLQLTDFTTLGANAETCPCRVKVWKLGASL